MKSKTGSEVLWTVPRVTPGRKASLQARATEEVEDLCRISRATAGAGHHQEGAGLRERYENAATQLEFEACNNEEYDVEGIWDSAVHAKESECSRRDSRVHSIVCILHCV